MDYYEQNLETIKNNRPFLYQSLTEENSGAATNRLEEIRSVITKKSEKAVVIKYRNKEFRLNSSYSPAYEAERWANQYEFQNINSIMLLFGFGNGVFAGEIMNRMKANDKLLIYEPCGDIFYHVLHNYDLADILGDKRISIAVENINEFEFHNLLFYYMDVTNINSFITCMHPHFDKIFESSCILFWKEIKAAVVHTRTNINTIIRFGRREIDNLLFNLKYLKDSSTIWELKELIPDKAAAVIVAAGPSVASQIEELKRAKGRAVIFAVDRILDYLLDAGVVPDFAVTVDPMKPIEYFSKRKEVTIPLICLMYANHEILRLHTGKKIICNATEFLAGAYKKINKKPPLIPSSPSVATTAFSICAGLGFQKIILVGQDLAYDGKYSHAGGTEEVNGYQQDVFVEDIHGESVRSRTDWKAFITWYQDRITLSPEIQVIDAKDKGAKIKGTLIMPLKDAIDTYCDREYSLDGIMKQIERTNRTEDILRLKEYLEKSLASLERIKKRAREGIKECNQLIDRTAVCPLTGESEKSSQLKLGKINKYITKQPVYFLMDFLVEGQSAEQLVKIKQLTGDDRRDNLDTYEKSKFVYEAIIEASDYIKPGLKEAIQEFL